MFARGRQAYHGQVGGGDASVAAKALLSCRIISHELCNKKKANGCSVLVLRVCACLSLDAHGGFDGGQLLQTLHQVEQKTPGFLEL